MKRSIQQGFTLIGVDDRGCDHRHAWRRKVALPAYQDYTVRAKVAGLVGASSAKITHL